VAQDPDWKPRAAKAGSAVLHRRVELGYQTRGQFADDANLTIKTLGQIERGVRPSYNKSTYATIDRVLQWEPGTFEALLAGDASAPPPCDRSEPVDISPELAAPDGLAMWMRPDSHPLAYLLHHAGLDEPTRMELIKGQRERNDRWLLESLDALAADITAAGGDVRREAWLPWLVERYGWKVPGDDPDGP
jgi:hypothetical protein